MRILSWNVNGIRAIEKKGFLEWLKKEEPDILCIQETKAQTEQLSSELISPEDKNGNAYKSYWMSAKKLGYSGVALYSKIEALEINPLGIAEFDDEGRVLQANFGNFIVISAYFPNSQENGARLDYKLGFCKAILDKINDLVLKGNNIILCGDYNIAHKEIDLANPKQNENNPGYLPEERAWLNEFINTGFVDTFRTFYPDKAGCYTWWSYRAKARERNIGWRLDYQCVNQTFMQKVKSAKILSEIKVSDHCPVELNLCI